MPPKGKFKATKYPPSKKRIESPNVITGKRGDSEYEQLGHAVMQAWSDHRDAHTDFLSQFVTDDLMYLSDTKGEMSKSKVQDSTTDSFVMETFRNVESVWSSVEQMIFGDQPFFEALPGSLSDAVMDKVVSTETALENIFDEMRFRSKFSKYGRSLVLNGTGIAEVPWSYITRQVRNDKGEYERQPLIDCQDFIPIPLVRFAFQPGATCIEDSDYVIKSFEMNKDQLESLIISAEKVGGEVRHLKELEDNGELNSYSGVNEGSSDITRYPDQILKNRGYQFRYKNKMITGLEYWGKNPDDKDDPRDWRILIVEQNSWVIKMPNKYNHGMKPFVRGTFIEQQDSFYGLGIGKICKRSQIMVNHYRNLVRDIAKAQGYSMWQQQGNYQNRSGNLKYVPNKILPTHEWGILSPLRPPVDAIPLIMQMEETDKMDMRYATSATNTAQAMPSGGTATESKIMASESTRRLAGIAQNITEQVIKPLMDITLSNLKQFQTGKRLVRMISGEGISYAEKGNESLMEKPIFRIRLATDIDFRDKIQRRLSSTLQTLAQVGEAVPEYKVEIMPLVKALVKTFHIDPREVVSKGQVAPTGGAGQQAPSEQPSPSTPLPSGGEQPTAEGGGLSPNQDAQQVESMKNQIMIQAIKEGLRTGQIPPEKRAEAEAMLQQLGATNA